MSDTFVRTAPAGVSALILARLTGMLVAGWKLFECDILATQNRLGALQALSHRLQDADV